eukprot:4688514-Amphidinium_carterae.1
MVDVAQLPRKPQQLSDLFPRFDQGKFLLAVKAFGIDTSDGGPKVNYFFLTSHQVDKHTYDTIVIRDAMTV